MAEKGFKRKLTAILSADAVGYSRLMAEDEAATVKTMASYREIMSSLIKQHRGRVVDSPGDNVLAEFPSVVDSVQCAVAVQNEFQTRNAELAENRRMEFRIGINLGDVIDEEDRIYGDGVNIAARLESIADPGGICVSKTAFDQIETKLPLGYEYLGEQSIKNIPKPVGAYRVLMRPDAAGKVIGEKRFLGRFSRKTAMTAIIILLVVAGALISWNIYLQQSKKVESTSIEKMAFPLPEKPSIAVLPFDNLSGDSEQDYIADGISENIINALSYIPQMFVIARNSSFSYKGKPVKVQQVSEELGVRYVLEGSVLKSEDKFRVTAQLIDALTGGHIWSERFDRELKDLLEMLDDITMKILTELHVKLAADESVRIYGKETENLQAYLKLLEGDQHRFLNNKADNEVAKRLYQEALAIDPNYAAAYTSLASALTLDVWLGASKSPKDTLLKAMKMAQKAIDLEKSDALAHGQLGSIFLIMGQHDKAIAQGEKALTFAPNNSHLLYLLGASLNLSGRAEEAYPLLQRATRMNPLYPNNYDQLGISCGLTGRYEEGITAVKKALHLAPDDMFAYRVLVFLHISSGRENDALAAANEALRRDPNYSFVKGLKRAPWKDQAFVKRFTELYQKAGLP